MTRFIPVAETQGSVAWLLQERRESLTLVSRHGLGDNVFFSPCFKPLTRHFDRVFFCSAVNGYTTIFHESPYVTPLYAGGVNGGELELCDGLGFINHFQRLKLDLGVTENFVYHFGLFEPSLPYTHPQAFVKGRRNSVEMGLEASPATEAPAYHVAPDSASEPFIDAALGRWLEGRELIVIARYGHTDPEKNFGHDQSEVLATVDGLDRAFPGRFKFLSLDYVPGPHAADGHRAGLRSVYGFLPCDAASLYHVLARARLFITVPTGPMLVGAAVPSLSMLTLWKAASPWHYLDPQGGRKVWALVEHANLLDDRFMDGWTPEEAEAVASRWEMVHAPVDAAHVVMCAVRMLEGG